MTGLTGLLTPAERDQLDADMLTGQHYTSQCWRQKAHLGEAGLVKPPLALQAGAA